MTESIAEGTTYLKRDDLKKAFEALRLEILHSFVR